MNGYRFHKGKAMDLIMDESCRLSSDAKYVAVHLVNRSKPDEERPGWYQTWPASMTIARATSLKLRAVEQAIADLRRLGPTLPVRIEIERRYRPGSGGRDSNMYRFTIPAAVAGMPIDHTRNGRGLAGKTIPAENADHTRRNGGVIPAAGAEESSKEPSQEPSQGKSARSSSSRSNSGRRRKPEQTMPSDFTPSEASLAHAVKLGFDRSRVDVEIGKMRDNALKKDQRWRDWNAALRTWLTRAHEFQERDRTNGGTRLVQRDAKPDEYNWRDALPPETKETIS